jgi:hypothetical protein
MIRPIGFGLAVALLFSALAGASSASAAPKAPDAASLVQQAGLPCTITASRFIDKGTLADGVEVSFYEVACQEGFGWVVISRSKAPLVDTLDCLSADRPGPDKKPSKIACKLPANANPTASLTPFMTKAGRNCVVNQARVIGNKPTQTVFEVACQSGAGFILQIPRAAGGELEAVSCMGYDQVDVGVKCQLTTPEQRAAGISQLVATSGKPCTVKGQRYVGATKDNVDVVEVACTEGKGYILEIDNSGKLKSEIDCMNSADCTLTDTRAAQTEQNGVYAKLAKKAGFDCDVSKYAAFPTDKPGLEVVELQCSNRTDGGVGIFQTGASGRVLDCVRAQTEGYHCTFTKEEAVYPGLTAQLVAKGKASCVVSGARGLAHTAEGEELVEVACSDGGPGWVLDYPPNATQPGSLLNCVAAAKFGAACELPTNVTKH